MSLLKLFDSLSIREASKEFGGSRLSLVLLDGYTPPIHGAHVKKSAGRRTGWQPSFGDLAALLTSKSHRYTTLELHEGDMLNHAALLVIWSDLRSQRHPPW